MAEIQEHSFGWRPETVYLGGGTPSSMNLAALAGALGAVPGKPWREATIEASPGTITAEKARAWRTMGIDRVSLGAQSFVREEIAATGRKHTAETMVSDIGTLADAGITNYNIDLIAGLARQTRESWRISLERVLDVNPPHVSVYMLEIDDDSRLGREKLLGGTRCGAAQVPSDSEIADMYESAVETLERGGLRRYEISNFARPGFESRHNLKYWRLEPYVGFGADAHSFDGQRRWSNPESPADYVRERKREFSEANPAEERFFVGLRLMEGIRPSAEEWRRFDEPIRRFAREGLLEAEGGVLRLTGRGVLVSNEIFQEFVS